VQLVSTNQAFCCFAVWAALHLLTPGFISAAEIGSFLQQKSSLFFSTCSAEQHSVSAWGTVAAERAVITPRHAQASAPAPSAALEGSLLPRDCGGCGGCLPRSARSTGSHAQQPTTSWPSQPTCCMVPNNAHKST